MVLTLIQMELNILVNSETEKSKDEEYLYLANNHSLLETNTLASSKMTNTMDKAFSPLA